MADRICHRVRLAGVSTDGSVVPAGVPLMLQQLAAQALAVAFRGCSSTPRGSMAWYAAMIQTQLMDWRRDPTTGDTVLTFAAPVLEETLWPSAAVSPESTSDAPDQGGPVPGMTCFDLLVAALADLLGGQRDSPRWDPGMLRTLTGLHRIFTPGSGDSAGGEYTALWLESRWSRGQLLPHVVVCPLGETACVLAKAWRTTTPATTSGIIRGRLTGLRTDLGGFNLTVEGTEQTVPGILPDALTLTAKELLGTSVDVLGQTVFRPSGRIQYLMADRIGPPGSVPTAGHHADEFLTDIVLLEGGEDHAACPRSHL